MNILVLSDLHIDSGDKFGIFNWDTETLINYMETLIYLNNVEKVILNGDIYELVKYRFEDIKKANPRLVEYLSQPKFVYIRGNHDIVSKSALDSYLIKNSSGQTVYFEHGHKADFLNGTLLGRWVTKNFLVFVNRLMKANRWICKAYFKYIEFNDQINHIPKKYNSYKYLKHALKLLKTYDVVFLGHTHKIEAHHTYYLNRKKRYINCGSCSLGRFQAVLFNTESLRYEIIKTDKEKLSTEPKRRKEVFIHAS